MSKARIYARNLLANWIGYVVNLATVLLLSWFTFRYLGDLRYGLWSLVMSLTGYFGMFDLGLRPALYRHFNWYLGRKETDKINEVVCTGLAAFLVSTIVLILAGIILASLLPWIFPRIPDEFVLHAQIALVIIAANVGLSMTSAVFGSLIETHERYDLRAILDVVVAVTRTACSIAALMLGFGMIGLALATLFSTTLACAGGYLISRYVFRSLRITRSGASRGMLWELVRFGIPCFFSGLGIRIILYTDALLIAWLIDLPSVGYYSLAVMLIGYGRSLVQKGATIFTPEIQQSVARNDLAGLRYFVPLVTRVGMSFGVLVVVGIMAFGPEFLALFYGLRVGGAGGPVLFILGFAYLGVLASRPCAATLIGAGRVKLLAGVVLLEAMVNVGLTIFFVAVAGLGLPGVALGTMIPMVLLSGLVISTVGARHLRMSAPVFAVQTAAHWIPGAAVFGLVCFGLSQLPLSLSWGWFAAKVSISTLAYLPVVWFMIMPPSARQFALSSNPTDHSGESH